MVMDRLRRRERKVFSGFLKAEIEKMEYLLRKAGEQCLDPSFCKTTARRFSCLAGRAGKPVVKWTEVQNWFQNRLQECLCRVSPHASIDVPRISGDYLLNNGRESPEMPKAAKRIQNQITIEFEARSLRDGAWYDVDLFLAHRDSGSGEGEVLVRFIGFSADHDEWVNVRNDVRQRSVPLENSECHEVSVGDMLLCFQERRDHALYYDARVLEIQRRAHDMRGCRCQFFIQYEHDKTKERVPLKRICRIQTYYALSS